MIELEAGPGGRPVAFGRPRAVIAAQEAAEVLPALDRADAARAGGGWIAGYLAYEAGYALEPRLAPLMPARRGGPLVLLGVFEGPEPSAPPAPAVVPPPLSRLRPLVARRDYAAAFARVKDWIAAGDCYQANLTFPMAARTAASPAALHAALAARGAARFGALIDLGPGPAVVSRSPELFFAVEGGTIRSRPMKGTAPRSPDPAADARLAADLAASDKARAENLMIVDLIRNDLGRLAVTGSVRVPELWAVETFPTVHQMSSTVTARLAGDPGLSGLMRALFPCGSVTGAPKIRAMEIIRAVERHPRGVYCGAIGWMAPGGDACFSVAIRTLSVWPGGRVRLGVGGGVVTDSTVAGEWEEALWKARFAQAT